MRRAIRLGLFAALASSLIGFSPSRAAMVPLSAVGRLPTQNEANCNEVFRNPHAFSDAVVVACGHAHQLGECVATGTCETCACSDYIKVTTQCDAHGMCTAPLSGTGCVDGRYYSGTHEGIVWNCNQPTSEGVAACMLRRLIDWGQCGE